MRKDKVYIKITSVRDKKDKILKGRIFLADFCIHMGDGKYSVQVWDEGKCFISNCRLRFIKKENNPEYFL